MRVEKVLRQQLGDEAILNTKEAHYHHGTIKNAARLKSSGINRLIEDALWTQGIRKKTNLKETDMIFRLTMA